MGANYCDTHHWKGFGHTEECPKCYPELEFEEKIAELNAMVARFEIRVKALSLALTQAKNNFSVLATMVRYREWPRATMLDQLRENCEKALAADLSGE